MQRENRDKKVVNKISVILNLIQDLIRFLKRNKVEMLKRVQHDVFFNYNAFTLIELLVVVLIIGILAAVAVPQYQKAVEKSRAREALSLLKSVYQAAKAYEMANGAWPESFDELAVEIPWTGNVRWRESSYIRDTRSNDLWSLQLYKNRGDEQVLLGRISGKYEGVGFGINSGGAWSCVEKTAKGKVFSGKTGDYCVKIMRTGTTYTTYSSGRYYSYQP